MIKNSPAFTILGVALAVAGAGCGKAGATERPHTYQGIVELDDRVLAFEVAGRVERVTVDRGDGVEPGQVLATLDETLAKLTVQARQAEVQAAEAQLDLLRAGARPEEIRTTRARLKAALESQKLIADNLARQRRLHGEGATTEVQLESTEAQLAQAQAERSSLQQQLRAQREGARSQEKDAAAAHLEAARTSLELAKEQLARHTLRAKEPGSVLDVHAEPAEVVAPGTPVVTVANLDHPYADVFVPQGAVGGIHVGDEATVRVDSLKKPLGGHVEYIARQMEFTPRFLFSPEERPNLVLRVRVRIDDPHHRLHAGIPAFATIGEGAK